MPPRRTGRIIMIDEEFSQQFDAAMAASEARVRQVLYEHGRPDLVAEYDAKRREDRLGIRGARATWHSISMAQRAALQFAAKVDGRLVRSALRKRYICGRDHLTAPKRPIHIKTIRNLCARELMAWDGGAFQPEDAAVITERGMFVLAHRLPDGQTFAG